MPFADLLYACDGKWWDAHEGAPEFKGIKVTYHPAAALKYGLHRIAIDTKARGLSLEPGRLVSQNSGMHALNLAVQLGARRIRLVGYDMKTDRGKMHFFGNHPGKLHVRHDFSTFIEHFEGVREAAQALGVEILNCTPDSALHWFKRARLEDVICASAA